MYSLLFILSLAKDGEEKIKFTYKYISYLYFISVEDGKIKSANLVFT